jgi:hypothetical protein
MLISIAIFNSFILSSFFAVIGQKTLFEIPNINFDVWAKFLPK